MNGSALAGLGALLLLGCSADSDPTLRHRARGEGTPLARFGEDAVTQEELEEQLASLNPLERAQLQSEAQRKRYVEGLVRFERLVQEALARGLQRRPEVIQAYKRALVEAVLRQELEEKPLGKLEEPELAAYYAAHASEFSKPLEAVKTQVMGRILGQRRAEAYRALLRRLEEKTPLSFEPGALSRLEVDPQAPARRSGGRPHSLPGSIPESLPPPAP